MSSRSVFTFVLEKRKWILIAYVLVIIPMAILAAQIQTDNSLDRLVAPTGEEKAAFERFNASFGSDEFILIGLQGTDLFSEPFLTKMDEAELALRKTPRLIRSHSLISIYRAIHPLFNPSSAADREAFKTFVTSTSFFQKQGLIAPNKMMSVVLQLNITHSEQRREVVGECEKILKPFEDSGAFTHIRKVGQPYIDYELDSSTSEIGLMFLPIYLFFSLGFTYLLYRSVLSALAVLASVLVSLAITVGIVSISGSVLTMLSSIMPVMVMILSTETSIYIYSTYVRLRDEEPDPRERLLKALTLKWKPCWYAILTTLIGFAAFLPSNMRTVRDLGTFVAIGVVIAYGVSVTLFPILFDWIRPVIPAPKQPGLFARGVNQVLGHIPHVSYHLRWVIVPLVLLLGVVAFEEYRHMEMETETLAYLNPQNAVYQDTTFVQNNVRGLMSLEIMLEGKKGTFASPDVLRSVYDFEGELHRAPQVQGTLSSSTLISTGHFIETGSESFPDSNFTIAKYIAMLSQQDMWRSYITADFDRLRISTVTRDEDRASFVAIRDQAQKVWKTFIEQNPAFKDVKITFTGMSPLIANISKYLYDTLDFSFLISLVAVFCVYLLQLHSLRYAFAALLPSVMSVFFMYWVMAATGTRLDVGTVVIASIVMGVADNASIHVLQHYTDRRKTGASMMESLTYAYQISGRGVFIAAAVIVFGFMTFGLSNFPPIRHFGLYTGIAILFALAGTLIFMPAFLWLLNFGKERASR